MRKQVREQGQSRMALCAGSEAQASDLWIRGNGGWPLQQLELKTGGQTGEQLLMWTGDILMDLNGNQALKMTPKTIDGTEYLFVESGGFNAGHGHEWQCPLYVMKRK